MLLSVFLFSVGLVIVLTKQQALFVLLGIELMIHATCLNFVVFGNYDAERQQGQIFVLFILAMVVCETAVALAIMFKVRQHCGTLMLDKLRSLRET